MSLHDVCVYLVLQRLVHEATSATHPQGPIVSLAKYAQYHMSVCHPIQERFEADGEALNQNERRGHVESKHHCLQAFNRQGLGYDLLGIVH